MRRIAVALLFAVFTLGFLSACSSEPVAGIVVDRKYVEPYDVPYSTPMYMTTCSGNPSVCSQMLIGFNTGVTHYDEEWHLVLKRDDNGELKEIEVPRDVYDDAAAGGHYDQNTGELSLR